MKWQTLQSSGVECRAAPCVFQQASTYSAEEITWPQAWPLTYRAIYLEWLNATTINGNEYIERTRTLPHLLTALAMVNHENMLFISSERGGKEAGECTKLLWVHSAGLWWWWIIARYYRTAHTWSSRTISLWCFLSSA